LLWAACSACSSDEQRARPITTGGAPAVGGAAGEDADVTFTNATLPGGQAVNLMIRAGRFASVGGAASGGDAVDLGGSFVVPAFIDCHVHLSYLAVSTTLARSGVAAVVDLGAPLASLGTAPDLLTVIPSGPIVTATAGYPTQSWGRNGYGLEVTSPADAQAAVDRLRSAGSRVIKIALTEAPTLDDATARAIVERAHAHGMRVVAHALDAVNTSRAAELGVDALAHTPVEPLPAAVVRAWAGRAVISTLDAFGAAPTAVENLRALRAAGAIVLYGTDLGNTTTPAIQRRELELLAAAGLDARAILEAATTEPARYFGLSELGRIAPGSAASFLVLDSDPLADAQVLSRPAAVYLAGSKQ
jgi:imidazolonepropionase-like amidohydrolase